MVSAESGPGSRIITDRSYVSRVDGCMASQDLATLLRNDARPVESEDDDLQVAPPTTREARDRQRSAACEICGSVLLRSVVEGANGTDLAIPSGVDATNATRPCGFRPLPSPV